LPLILGLLKNLSDKSALKQN